MVVMTNKQYKRLINKIDRLEEKASKVDDLGLRVSNLSFGLHSFKAQYHLEQAQAITNELIKDLHKFKDIGKDNK